jgi:hypothetical protein
MAFIPQYSIWVGILWLYVQFMEKTVVVQVTEVTIPVDIQRLLDNFYTIPVKWAHGNL